MGYSSLLVVVRASHCGGFSLLPSICSRAHRLQWLWHVGLAALWSVESSQIRDRTCVPCIGRQIQGSPIYLSLDLNLGLKLSLILLPVENGGGYHLFSSIRLYEIPFSRLPLILIQF